MEEVYVVVTRGVRRFYSVSGDADEAIASMKRLEADGFLGEILKVRVLRSVPTTNQSKEK